MTAKEFAKMLSGREYGLEITKEEAEQAAAAGLVVVYGYSDDNMEFEGAIDDEWDSYEGATVYVDKTGLLWGTSTDDYNRINAVWHDDGNPCWTFETNIPHETFNIYEDEELFCIGIVFRMEDLR